MRISEVERWYMQFNGSLVLGGGLLLIGVFWLLAWWLGPQIIAKGIGQWSKDLSRWR